MANKEASTIPYPVELETTRLTVDEALDFYVREKAKRWLSSFNTDSATCCFTAVNLLKQELEGKT